MSRKKPWLTRLFPNLYSCLNTQSVSPGVDGTGGWFRPRIATDNHVRVLMLRTHTGDGREVYTPMTPEQAIDLGTAMVKAGKAIGMANLRHGDGWIVNEAKPGDGWRTGTASAHPDEIDWSKTP